VERSNAYRVFVKKPEVGIALGRPRCRWKDDITVDAKERD
jgi:hypothetical protein